MRRTIYWGYIHLSNIIQIFVPCHDLCFGLCPLLPGARGEKSSAGQFPDLGQPGFRLLEEVHQGAVRETRLLRSCEQDQCVLTYRCHWPRDANKPSHAKTRTVVSLAVTPTQAGLLEHGAVSLAENTQNIMIQGF